MSKLDDALDRWQQVCDDFDALLLGDLTSHVFVERFTNGGEQAGHRLAEAARKVANPDYQAAAKAVDVYEVFVASDGCNAIRTRSAQEIATAAVDTALGITEDTE